MNFNKLTIEVLAAPSLYYFLFTMADMYGFFLSVCVTYGSTVMTRTLHWIEQFSKFKCRMVENY